MIQNKFTMVYLAIIWLLNVCSVFTFDDHQTTHWIVTETGLIEPKAYSPYQLERPHDLLTFLKQDTRWETIFGLYHELWRRQEDIQTMWTTLEIEGRKILWSTKEGDCGKAGVIKLIDLRVSQLEDGRSKNVPKRDFNLYVPLTGVKNEPPDCKKIAAAAYKSISDFDNLQSMKDMDSLNFTAEKALPFVIQRTMNMEQFATWTTNNLRKNLTSWLHFNLASLYWRIKGNASKSLECSKAAVYHAPRRYKDIPLQSIGTVFHRSHRPEDAIVVFQKAVEYDNMYTTNHFLLANAYAAVGEFDRALNHYEESIKLAPDLDIAVQHKHGILCLAEIITKLPYYRSLFYSYREALQEYDGREKYLLEVQSEFLQNVKNIRKEDYMDIEKACDKMFQLTGLKMRDLKTESNKLSMILFYLEGPLFSDELLKIRGTHTVDGIYSTYVLLMHADKHKNDKVKELPLPPNLVLGGDMVVRHVTWSGVMPAIKVDITVSRKTLPVSKTPKIDKTEKSLKTDTKNSDKKKPKDDTPKKDESYAEYHTGKPLYPNSMEVRRDKEDFDTDPEWPSTSLCNTPGSVDNVEVIIPTFMPFENKGIGLDRLLTNKIGVPANIEHELPWHPPACPENKEALAFAQKKAQKPHLMIMDTDYLRSKLLQYVGDGSIELVKNMQDAEIGHRIYAAMNMKLAPKWILYTMASLYWRVRQNNVNALSCLMNATKIAKTRYKDIVLSSLASVYLEMGHPDEALAVAEEAYKISMYEPATNFLLAELNMLKRHRSTHMFHLKQVSRVEPGFMLGAPRALLAAWACVLKEVNALQELANFTEEEDTCTDGESEESKKCEKGVSDCHVSQKKCKSSNERGSSTIVRMLEQNVRSSSAHIDASIFEQFIENTPTERGDFARHSANYQLMLDAVYGKLHGCGPRGCQTIKPEDLAITPDHCIHTHLQLGYYMFVLGIIKLFKNTEFRIPSPEIDDSPPSHKQVPECREYGDPTQDFFLERLSRISGEGWSPMIALMHQFTELLSSMDYMSVGPKIGKYLETNPQSWMGAVVAGWWCAAGGRGACAVRCLAAAYARAPPHAAVYPVRTLAAMLAIQAKYEEAKEVAQLAFYMSPNSKIEAFFVAVSHTYVAEYEQAVWMYRYALTFDDQYHPAKTCLHAAICRMLFGTNPKAIE